MHDSKPRESEFPALALVAALGAAFVGALAWAAIAYVTEYELGYAAWGIGVLVGFATVKLGGRGTTVGAIAACLTIASIFGGKMLTADLVIGRSMGDFSQPAAMRPHYDEAVRDAAGWLALSDPEDEAEVRRFLVDHRFVDVTDPRQVTQADLAGFYEYAVPYLEWMAEDEPDFASWMSKEAKEARAAWAEASLTSIVLDSLGPIDLLFAALAVASAFGMVARVGSEQRPTPPASGLGTPTSSTAPDQQRRAA